ncbi:helix-turn-helix transcriptional regulator [Pelagibacterium sp.]|uniref:helix-turn-helix transcriptional regulator n=1 Tax=Pelagibacterium sp. TaxID=1967288 RepID=UPI003A9279DA
MTTDPEISRSEISTTHRVEQMMTVRQARPAQRAALAALTEIHPPQADFALPEGDALPDRLRGTAGRWSLFEARFSNGQSDLIALWLSGGPHDVHCGDILAALWPVLREDCLRERAQAGRMATEGALLWTISQKTDSAVLVLDPLGRVLDQNEAGREFLERGHLLQLDQGRLVCANRSETRAFYEAVAECAGLTATHPCARNQSVSAPTPPAGSTQELILFLQQKGDGMRLPVSLSRYVADRSDLPLVVAILPCQPDRTRIEMMAQKMGLSPTEARVAALMQLGLSNREAAHIAGLKEQTFNTYAKRVLAKLDVAGRAEMAQRLTWQAAWGRAS